MAKASTTTVMSSSSPITPPDRRKYEADVSKISELIKEKEKQIDLVAIDGKNDTEELTQLGLEVESYEDRRSRILIEIKTIDEKLRKLGIEIAKHKAESNRLVVGLKYMTEEKYDEQIKKLQFELNSRRYAPKDERLLQDEIAYLIEARSKVFGYQTARKSVDSCRNEQDGIRKEKDGLHHEIKTIREKSNTAKDKMNHCRQNLERKREQKRERKNRQDMISKEIRDLHIQRRQLHDDFRQHQLLYMEAMKNNSTDVHHHHTTTKEDEENDRGTKRKSNKTTALSVPTEQNTEEEWLMCRTLITYFSRFLETRGDSFLLAPKPEHGRNPSSHGSSSPDVSPGSPSRRLTDISPSDGNFLLRKKETEEEWLPSTRQRKDSVRKDRKKSRKEKKANSKNQQRPLQLNATIFSQFTRLGLRPPTSISDVENTLEVLKQKMSIFDGHRLSVVTTDSEAGDSGIMSSTGISEISEYGGNDLTSGEVTPNTISRNELSPVPTESHHADLLSDEGLIDTTPLNSLKESIHVGSKTDTEGSVCSDMSTPTSTPAESTDGILLTTDNQRKVED